MPGDGNSWFSGAFFAEAPQRTKMWKPIHNAHVDTQRSAENENERQRGKKVQRRMQSRQYFGKVMVNQQAAFHLTRHQYNFRQQ
jgi:membrane-anchored protein YejM (alkaline phosphatase superfamily)